MKKIILLFALSVTVLGYSQSAKQMLTEIEGKWELDDNGNVTVVKIVEVPEISKTEIFNRTLSYFTYNYINGKSVIQTQDKEIGLIVGKGIYDNVHIGASLVTTYVDAWHVLRVDIKEGRARIVVSLTDYDKKIVGGDTPPAYVSMKVAQEYPINLKGGQKTIMTKAFYKAFKKANESLDAVEKAIKEGNTSKSIENNGW